MRVGGTRLTFPRLLAPPSSAASPLRFRWRLSPRSFPLAAALLGRFGAGAQSRLEWQWSHEDSTSELEIRADVSGGTITYPGAPGSGAPGRTRTCATGSGGRSGLSSPCGQSIPMVLIWAFNPHGPSESSLFR